MQVRVILQPGCLPEAPVGLDFLAVAWTSCPSKPCLVPIHLSSAPTCADSSENSAAAAALSERFQAVADSYQRPESHVAYLQQALATARDLWIHSATPQHHAPADLESTGPLETDRDDAQQGSPRVETELDSGATMDMPSAHAVASWSLPRPSTGSKRTRATRPPVTSRACEPSCAPTGDPLPPTAFSAPIQEPAEAAGCLAEKTEFAYVPLRLETKDRVATVTQTVRLKERRARASPPGSKAAPTSTQVSAVGKLSNVPSGWDPGLGPSSALRSLRSPVRAKQTKASRCFKVDGKWCGSAAHSMQVDGC